MSNYTCLIRLPRTDAVAGQSLGRRKSLQLLFLRAVSAVFNQVQLYFGQMHSNLIEKIRRMYFRPCFGFGNRLRAGKCVRSFISD